MKHIGLGWALNRMTGVRMRKEREIVRHRDTDTQGRRPCDDGGGVLQLKARSTKTPRS